LRKKLLALIVIVVTAAAGFVGFLYGGIGTREQLGQSPSPSTASGYPYSCLDVGFPCVILSYRGWVYSSLGDCEPGYFNDVLLILEVSFLNNGYDRTPTGQSSMSSPSYGYYFHVAVEYHDVLNGTFQYDAILSDYLSCLGQSNIMPITDIANGLTVKGYLLFDVPADFESYTLIYRPESGSYNIGYVNEGYLPLALLGSQSWYGVSAAKSEYPDNHHLEIFR
jgi:hypothetical protein